MPIFGINNQLHYFAHVPKCGGTAVAAYLATRFGPLGLAETDRHLVPAHRRWTRTAAEHVSVDELCRVIPDQWLVSSFAVVRHPVRRLISAFFFSRDITRKTALTVDFNNWALKLLPRLPDEPYLIEGHLRPQTLLVPADARVFRLEDGLDPIIPYLDGLAGNSDGPRSIAPRNVGHWRQDEATPEPQPELLELIARIYAEDFQRFGYAAPASSLAAADLPDLPVLPATGELPKPPRRPLIGRFYRKLIARIPRQ